MNKSNCFCEKCNYKAKCISDYNKHLLSKKHNQEELEYNYECKICLKKYRCNSGLWYHKKTCNVVIQEPSNNQETPKISNENVKTLIIQNEEIKEQNQQHQKEIEELKKLIIELTKRE